MLGPIAKVALLGNSIARHVITISVDIDNLVLEKLRFSGMLGL